MQIMLINEFIIEHKHQEQSQKKYKKLDVFFKEEKNFETRTSLGQSQKKLTKTKKENLKRNKEQKVQIVYH